MDFYIDSAVLCGFVLNYICLNISSGLLFISVSVRKKALFSFLLAAVGALSVVFSGIRLVFVPVYAAAVRLFYGRCGIAEFLRRTAFTICSSLVISALLLTLIPRASLSAAVIDGREFITAEDVPFYTALAAVYALAKAVLYAVSREKKIFRVVLYKLGEAAETYAMLDTGNSLRADGGAPVIVAESSLFSQLGEPSGSLCYKTVSDRGAKADIFLLDELYFPDENRRLSGVYALFVDRPLSDKGRFRVLLGRDILKRRSIGNVKVYQ